MSCAEERPREGSWGAGVSLDLEVEMEPLRRELGGRVLAGRGGKAQHFEAALAEEKEIFIFKEV